MKIIVNPNREIVEEIDKGLNKNNELYGARYCPCSLIMDINTICPCKEFREQTEKGYCHCGKYSKVEN